MRSAGYLVNCIAGTPKAALALLDFAKADAARILAARKHQVEAVAAALIEGKTLDGAEIEAIISESVLSPARKARRRWDAMAVNAALFTASHGGLKRLAI
jgi:hypothetical protein